MLGYVQDAVFGCDLPSTCIVVWLCAGEEGLSKTTYRGNRKGPLRTPGVEGQLTANSYMDQEEGPGVPFGMVDLLSWKPTQEGVRLTVLLPLPAAAEEACNNKNTG